MGQFANIKPFITHASIKTVMNQRITTDSLRLIWVSGATQSYQMYYFFFHAHLNLAWPIWLDLKNFLLSSSRSHYNICHSEMQFICSFFTLWMQLIFFIFYFYLCWYLPPFSRFLLLSVMVVVAIFEILDYTHTKSGILLLLQGAVKKWKH